MMDYYSQFSGPTRDGAIQEMNDKIDRCEKKQWLKKYISFYVDDEISKYGGLGSYTGWLVITEPIIWKNLLYKENIYNKWKKWLRVLRMYNVFMKMYIDVHYKPEGIYMKEMKDKYGLVFV